MQVKNIAECYKGSILQYFLPSLSYHLSLSSLFVYFEWPPKTGFPVCVFLCTYYYRLTPDIKVMVICFEFATLSCLLKSALLCEKINSGWSITLWASSQEFEPVLRVCDWVRFKLISPASEISKLQCISVLEDCLFFLNKRCKP